MRTFIALLIAGFTMSATVTSMGAELPDPTRPYLYEISPPVTSQGKGREEWHLTGVQIRPDSKSAIVNGTLVKVGDRIGPASVLKIQPGQVTLAENYRQIVIKLLSTDVKVRVGASAKN